MASIGARKIKISRDVKEDEMSIKKIDRWLFYMLIISIGIIPLLIGANTELFASPLISGSGITQTGFQSDLFTHYKFIALVAVTVICLVMFLYKLLFLNYSMKADLVTYAIFLFIFFTLLSVIFAEYKSISLWGMYNRHDGAIAFICFFVLMLIALNINYSKNALKVVTYALYPFVWINAVIALLTFYGKNILLNSTVQKLLTMFNGQDITFNEGSLLTGTLNQWNYMSGMSSIMVMIFLSLALFGKNIWFQMLNLLTAIAAFATLLVSISSSGFLAFLVMSVIMLVVLFLKGPKVKGLIVFVVFLILIGIPLSVFSGRNTAVWDNSVGMIVKTNPFVETEVGLQLIDSKAYAADTEFELPVLPERGLAAGSGRLYIWVTMLEMIQVKPLTGYGLDTIMFHFPQNELDKRAQMMNENVLVDKPHNMYLGILWGTGVFGFIAFVITLALLAVAILKDVYKKTSKVTPYTVALTMGFGAFLVQALFNDSVIGLSIAPLLIGTIIYANNNEESSEEIL